MILKGPGSILLLLLWTTLVFEASCQCKLRNKTFYRHHLDFPKSNYTGKYCDGIMKDRGLTNPKCTGINTFIHAKKELTGAVCGEGGEEYWKGQGVYRRSKNAFPVTVCKLRGASSQQPCSYDALSFVKQIVISCKKGRPVHYEEDQNEVSIHPIV